MVGCREGGRAVRKATEGNVTSQSTSDGKVQMRLEDQCAIKCNAEQ